VPFFERQYLTGSFYLYQSFLVIVAQPLSFTMARTLRAEPSALWITIRFLSRRCAPDHQANAAVSRPREFARVSASR